MDPRCKICIFMGKTDFEAARHKQQVRSQEMLLCESEKNLSEKGGQKWIFKACLNISIHSNNSISLFY